MKNISFVTRTYKNNECFDKVNEFRDNFMFYIINLKDRFKINNLNISTSDLNNVNDSIAVLQMGLLTKISDISKNKHYLLLQESPHFDKGLLDTINHKYFRKIFTWNDDMIDNIKYFKVNYAYDIPQTIPKQFDDKKLCCIIAGNKTANHPDELYTKRVEFIRWFEKNHSEEFDLYGTKWDQYRFGHSFFGKVLNKIKPLRKKNLFPSYQGTVDSKFDTMKNYKFSICYENIKDQSGYITEKIFDSFFAGCVPIYWGAKNVCDHIPKECFVDKRDFDSFEDIYKFIKDIDEKKYMSYINAIENFLNSSKADQFRAEVFANTIVGEIVKDINLDNN